MAGEIGFSANPNGTYYFQIWNRTSGFVWDSSGFSSYVSASGNLASYANTTTQKGSSSTYVGNAPSNLPAGTFDIRVFQRVNAWYAETDPFTAVGDLEWNSTIVVPLCILATSGQIAGISPIKLARGTSINNFPCSFVSSADGVTSVVSGICSGQVSRDGAPFTALQSGLFTEIGLGGYCVNLTSGDTNGNTLLFYFSCVSVSGGSALPVRIGMITQKVSGQ
jgi:hypothetical protein